MSFSESHLAQEAVAALVDGELPAGPATRAARHLAGCLQCRMAVQAQREAKDALHRCEEVTVPGDLLSRLEAIPFTAQMSQPAALDSIAAGPGELTVSGASGSWAVPLEAPSTRSHSRWFRRGVVGTVTGLGAGVVALALTLPAGGAAERGTEPAGPVAGPSVPDEHTEVVPPVVRTLTAGNPGAVAVAGPGGTP